MQTTLETGNHRSGGFGGSLSFDNRATDEINVVGWGSVGELKLGGREEAVLLLFDVAYRGGKVCCIVV